MPDVVETTEAEATDIDTNEGPEIEVPDLEAPEVEAVEVEAVEEEAPGVEVSDIQVNDVDITEVDTVEMETVEVEVTGAPAETGEAAEAEVTQEPVEVEVTEAVETAGADESIEPVEPVDAPKPASPYDLPGDWYVIHSYSGYENKVKANLETRIQSMHMGDRIFEVHIPMEDVVEFKAGKKVTVPKKVFPGYILVRMTLDDDSWYAVRNTPGVTGFVAGNAQKPTPLSRREVERFLGVQEEEERAKPRFKPDWEVGEQVRVVTGPFADFNGVIEDMNVDQQKVVVLVNIFGRDTPVELGFEDIQKS
ncbi:MAG: transcription termination/antitermination protein NusG [Actinomycetota bacterium]|nr:transcription termination/antitermination protein NusG [Actinomycetota bacterium]